MAKEIAITHSDLENMGGVNTINIACIDPEDTDSYATANILYNDLSEAEQTLLNDCMGMLEMKLNQ